MIFQRKGRALNNTFQEPFQVTEQLMYPFVAEQVGIVFDIAPEAVRLLKDIKTKIVFAHPARDRALPDQDVIQLKGRRVGILKDNHDVENRRPATVLYQPQ